MVQQKAYTEELTNKIIERYLAEPTRETIDAIADEIGKSIRSVIAKLSSAGVYKTPKRLTKTGEDIVKKEDLVKDINEWLGIEVPTLVKTGKLDLRVLHEAIRNAIESV